MNHKYELYVGISNEAIGNIFKVDFVFISVYKSHNFNRIATPHRLPLMPLLLLFFKHLLPLLCAPLLCLLIKQFFGILK